MDFEMKKALEAYGRRILEGGWAAGEPLILEGERRFEAFRQWAYALGICLRAREILDDP